MGGSSPEDAFVSGRGITVLSLLLLIIALVIVAFFLLRYLRPAG
jgi:flagellar biogenesis protein FliO